MSNQVQSSGTSLTTLLGVLFIGLKLTHFIDWSWKWVLSPFWIPLAIALAFLVVFGIAVVFGAKINVKRR